MSISKLLVTGAVTAATATAVGAGTVSAASTTSTKSNKPDMSHKRPPLRDGGKPVTDKVVIAKVKAAVHAKYASYTVDHVVKLPVGNYLALSRNASDKKIIVSVSANYEVTGTKAAPNGLSPKGLRPPMGMDHMGPPPRSSS